MKTGATGLRLPARYWLRRDPLAERLVYLMAVLAVLGLSPMAVVRYRLGETWVALVDVIVITLFVGLALFARFRGHAPYVALATVAVTEAIALVMISFRELELAFWVFPCLITLFFVLKPVIAAGAGLVVIALAGVLTTGNYTPLQQINLIIPLVIINVFVFGFSNQAAAMQERLDAQASVDPVTGLSNRRQMERVFDQGGAGLDDGPAAVLVVDLDHFKRVNDRFGHEAGDRVLARLGEVLAGALRRSDTVFRYGGEEFVVLLPQTDRASGERVAELLRRAVRERLDGEYGRMTVSVGVAECEPGQALSDAFALADRALYEAKAAGRDRVHPATQSPDAGGA